MANEKFKINGVVSEVVPTTGNTGEVLKKTASGVEWGTLVKKDVGLENTPNYGVASQSEAEAGTSSTKLMTPLRVKQAVQKLAAVTITKSDVGLGSVENIGIIILSEAEYEALSDTEKARTDKLYGTY